MTETGNTELEIELMLAEKRAGRPDLTDQDVKRLIRVTMDVIYHLEQQNDAGMITSSLRRELKSYERIARRRGLSPDRL